MTSEHNPGPDGRKVCSWCPLKNESDYYYDSRHPRCKSEGFNICNKIIGNRSTESFTDDHPNPFEGGIHR